MSGNRRASKPVASLSRTTGLLTFLVVLPILVSIMLAAIGLPVKGFDWLRSQESKVVAPKAVVPAVVDYSNTPANDLMDSTFLAMDNIWKASSARALSAGLPNPLDCVTPTPSLSQSQSYQVQDVTIQLTLAAYPAGVGAPAYGKLKADVASCKPSSTTIYSYDVSGLGVEATTLQAVWADNNVDTTFLRRGDLIAFIAVNHGVTVKPLAEELDANLKRLMPSTLCVNQEASVTDQYRNAFFSGGKFTGLKVSKQLTTEALPLPALTADQSSRGVKVVALKKRRPLAEVILPDSNASYPLWPQLPEPVAYPKQPRIPAAQKLTSNAIIREADPLGPGCGWAFLTTVEPVYDEASIATANDRVVTAAQALLDGDGPRWQAGVSTYWTAYASYLEAKKAYAAYGRQVNEVAQAWNAIHEQWKAYYTSYANWELRDKARKQLLADQAAANEAWTVAKDACINYDAALTVYETDLMAYREKSDYYRLHPAELQVLYSQWKDAYAAWELNPQPETEKGPAPVDPTPMRPAQPTMPETGCPAVRPAILDTVVPPAKPAPKKPADPRPLAQRN